MLPVTFDHSSEEGRQDEDSKVIWDTAAGILKQRLSAHRRLEMTFAGPILH